MSVFKPKESKYYYYEFQYNGKTYKKSTRKTSKAEARSIEAAARVEAENEQTGGTPDRPTLKAGAERCWAENWRHQKDGKNSLGRALRCAKYMGNPTIDSIDHKAIDDLKAYLLNELKFKPATVNRHQAALRYILNRAYKHWGLLDRVPPFEIMRENKKKPRIVSPEELDKTCKWLEAKGSYFPLVADLMRVLVDTGLRLNEALSLPWNEIKLENKKGATLCVQEQKGGGDNPQRTVPLTARAKETLQKLKGGGCDRPFPIRDHQAERVRREAMENVEGLEPFGFHDLRHTFATRLVEKGVPLYVVQKLLGHSNIKVTERYAHLQTDTLSDAVALLND